jgi:hypothetical protein
VASEAVVLAQRNAANRNVQYEHRFIPLPDNVRMRRSVIVRVNANPERANPQNGWH